jgi:hypothetical protein
MQEKKFKKKKEDFICEICGQFIKGDGYTNHCPKCLWSKHVDINPGDRQNTCKGKMEPVDAFFKNGKWILKQQCLKCEEVKLIKVKKGDSLDALQEIIRTKILK